jgi:hypothetical protein
MENLTVETFDEKKKENTEKESEGRKRCIEHISVVGESVEETEKDEPLSARDGEEVLEYEESRSSESVDPTQPRLFKHTSDHAESNLRLAQSLVEQHDWLNHAMMNSIFQLPTVTYLLIPPSCHLVETCCTKFRAFLKEKGLVMKMIRMTSEEIANYRPALPRYGIYYFRCVAVSFEIATAALELEKFLWTPRMMMTQGFVNSRADVHGGTVKKKSAATKRTHIPTAFNIFSNEIREKLRKENPSISFGAISVEIGNLWSSLTQSDKDVS